MKYLVKKSAIKHKGIVYPEGSIINLKSKEGLEDLLELVEEKDIKFGKNEDGKEK